LETAAGTASGSLLDDRDGRSAVEAGDDVCALATVGESEREPVVR
jgi:hypothetical protein